ncbi:MAG TPA: NAD(P)H-hydrate dehydratase [bacterium]|nr:NAD(P)H-hydrate dehydratase [bacterium]HQL62808.1 NAD(P)H-hydrate dehydratase [bacterium]
MSIPIVTGSVMASIDRAAQECWGVAGLYLMERAGEAFTQVLWDPSRGFDCTCPAVVCGAGNNGGDGFVIARRLASAEFKPVILMTTEPDRLRGDAKTSYQRLLEQGLGPIALDERTGADVLRRSIRQATVVVDAVLGTGISGAPKGLAAIAITEMNAAHAPVVSVDIASGVNADTGAVDGGAVSATLTVTFGLPKVGHFLPPGINFRGDLAIRDIGFPVSLLDEAPHDAAIPEEADIAAILPKRTTSCHKGTAGHLCVIAGSRNMSGAALLCARAACRAGAGLVTLAMPVSLIPIAAASLWEALLFPLPETIDGTLAEDAAARVLESSHRFTAAVIGPGLSQQEETKSVVRRLVAELPIPILIDADGLNALTPELLSSRPYPWAATPHPGELARLLDAASASEIQMDRWGWARRAYMALRGPVALKGAATVVAASGKLLVVNPTGGPEMASGGMGDVLSGIVGALLAQGCGPEDALYAGVYLHGLAADLLAGREGYRTLTAGDVSGMIQAAVAQVSGPAEGTPSRRVEYDRPRSR